MEWYVWANPSESNTASADSLQVFFLTGFITDASTVQLQVTQIYKSYFNNRTFYTPCQHAFKFRLFSIGVYIFTHPY